MTDQTAILLTNRVMEIIPPGERAAFADSEGMVMLAEAASLGWPFMVERLECGIYGIKIEKPKTKKKK